MPFLISVVLIVIALYMQVIRRYPTHVMPAGCAFMVSQITLNIMYGPLAAMFAELFAPTICAALFEQYGPAHALAAALKSGVDER